MHEILEQKKIKIGDPGGYCSSWSIWYASMVLKYPDLNKKKLILKLIYTFKVKQISLKDTIRYFTKDIIKIREQLFINTNIDINDWINNNYKLEQYNILINNIIVNFKL